MNPSDRIANPSGCQAVAPRRVPWWRRLRNRSPLLRYLFPPAVRDGDVLVSDHPHDYDTRVRVLYEVWGDVHYVLLDDSETRCSQPFRCFAYNFRKV